MSALITIDVAAWDELPLSFRLGVGGSNMRGKYIIVGPSAYVWWSHTVNGVATGYDPGDFESELAGMTGYELVLPAGDTTPEDHAALLAALIATIPGVAGAAPMPTANDDGSWSVQVETTLSVAWGSRAYASRGAAGTAGGEIYRVPEGSEASGWQQIEITRPIASRITALGATMRVWAVQLALGDTVNSANPPRMQFRWSGSDTSPAGTETFDFGRFDASQIVAGGLATIFLTPAQVLAFHTQRSTATGTRHWLQSHCTTGTTYVGAATSTGYGGQQINANIRVETVGSNNPANALATWSASGELNFAFLLGARVVYEIDPCTTLEHRTRWGSFAAYATHTSNVTLPDTLTGQRASVVGLGGRRIFSCTMGVVAGTAAAGAHTGGTHTEDAPSMIGATALATFGQNVSNGEVTLQAPTGASTVRVPTSGGLWWLFKGEGATGRGQVGPGPYANVGRPDQPDSWIRRFDTGGLRGRNPGERDIGRTAPGYGDDTTPFESPITDPNTTEYGPDNKPFGYFEIGTPAIDIVTTDDSLTLDAGNDLDVDAVPTALAAWASGDTNTLEIDGEVEVTIEVSLEMGLHLVIATASSARSLVHLYAAPEVLEDA